MIVVSNTSPITYLAAIGHLELLRQLYVEILIPNQVLYELTRKGGLSPGGPEALAWDWINTASAEDETLLRLLLKNRRMHQGEAEAIVLACEIRATLLILDDGEARKAARAQGLRIVGTLGVLAEAKRQGFLKAIRPLMDELVTHGFRVSHSVYQQVLARVGE